MKVESKDGNDSLSANPAHPQPTTVYMVVLALLSATGGFLFGYDTGVVSGATIAIAASFELNTLDKELFVSITGKFNCCYKQETLLGSFMPCLKTYYTYIKYTVFQ